MELGIPNRWVILRVERWRSMLRVTARDDQGREKTETVLPGVTSVRHGLRIATFTPPPALLKIIEGALAGLPEKRPDLHGDVPVTLPVFVALGPGLRGAFETAEPDWPANLAGRVQTVVLPARRRLRRPPFRLPLRVLAEATAPADLKQVQMASWFRSGLVQEHGMQIQRVGMEGLFEACRATPRDVVILETESLAEVLKEAKRLPSSGARPRLFLGIGPFNQPSEYRRAIGELPPGTSLLWVPEATSAPTLLHEFFMGIIHDQPLHDAIHTATQKTGAPALLVADPSSNQDLRLSEAVAGLRDEAVSIRTTAVGGFPALIEERRIKTTRDLTRIFHQAARLDSQIQSHISYALNVEANFGRETTGLAPIAYAEGQLAEARKAREKMEKILAPVRRSRQVREALRQSQERRVDMALQDLESVPVQAVPTTSTLRRGGLYRLRVHVGVREEKESVMVGTPPALDLLLPADPRQRGHTLHVVVYEKDFKLRSPRIRTLHLPDLGGSKPIHFDLRAPRKDGPAYLRIKVYYRNQLLQSFLLSAKIEQGDSVYPGEILLKVEPVYSRTARFSNLKDFKPRLLSVGVNQEADGDRHLFMFKMGKTAEAIDLSEAVLSQEIDRFRKILLDATIDEQNNARFSSYDVNPSKEKFLEVIRDLADAGRALHRALQVRMSKGLKERLRKVAQAADHTLQFVRDDPKYVFPWAILYDYGLPERRTGEAPPPVCMGGNCGHGPEDKVYCVNGFWGIRHALEVLLARAGELEDEVRVVERPARDAAIFVAVEKGDDIAEEMAEELKKDLGKTVRVAREEDELLDLLWDAKERPALLVLLGHLETKVIQGEPEGPRIVIFPKKRWVQADPVTDLELNKGSWTQPRTVVLLMACGAAATEVGTLNDFVTAFSSAGAAAVVGTECLVFSRLVARFSKDVMADLLNGKTTLGEAIKTFRRRLLDLGNPLGFVFTSAGNADLVFDLKG